MDRVLALQEALNSFKKICVWKKAIAFLSALPVPLQHAEWIPNHFGNFAMENEDGKWHTKIRVVDPYGNIFEQGLGGHGHSLTLLEFAHRLGLYNSQEIREDGFEVYFQGGLRNDDHFNANEYWLSISTEDELSLYRSLAKTIRNPVLRDGEKDKFAD
ncbi:hypothetical protein Tco_1091710 [Tanacetum coccineum]|uniref:Uncharacterized protein n=1 Tax=Tanacetum coccineum TaxID=301880 RepID=A0ABQ5I9Q2_9ASTR